MKNRKIILSLLLSILLVLLTCACSDNAGRNKSENSSDESQTDFLSTKEYDDVYEYDQRLTYDYDKSGKTLYIKGKGDMGVNKRKNVTVLELFPWSEVKNPVHIVIEDGVTSISDWAFAYNSNDDSSEKENHFDETKTVKIANTVTKIGVGAFSCGENLECVTLPDNITEMGEDVFEYCVSLKNIELPGSLKVIPKSICENCKRLKKVTIGRGTEIINSYAFNNCDELTKVSLPDTLMEIKGSAFYNCGKLKEITIPKSVESISPFSLGFKGHYKKVKGFTIKGYKGSAAHKYAEENKMKFVSIG